MEFHEIDDVDSYKLFKHSVEFLYEKNLKKFIGNCKEYKSSVFCLKNGFLSCIENNKIAGKYIMHIAKFLGRKLILYPENYLFVSSYAYNFSFYYNNSQKKKKLLFTNLIFFIRLSWFLNSSKPKILIYWKKFIKLRAMKIFNFQFQYRS